MLGRDSCTTLDISMFNELSKIYLILELHRNVSLKSDYSKEVAKKLNIKEEHASFSDAFHFLKKNRAHPNESILGSVEFGMDFSKTEINFGCYDLIHQTFTADSSQRGIRPAREIIEKSLIEHGLGKLFEYQIKKILGQDFIYPPHACNGNNSIMLAKGKQTLANYWEACALLANANLSFCLHSTTTGLFAQNGAHLTIIFHDPIETNLKKLKVLTSEGNLTPGFLDADQNRNLHAHPAKKQSKL